MCQKGREERRQLTACDSVRVCFLWGKRASGTLIAISISRQAVIFEMKPFHQVELTFQKKKKKWCEFLLPRAWTQNEQKRHSLTSSSFSGSCGGGEKNGMRKRPGYYWRNYITACSRPACRPTTANLLMCMFSETWSLLMTFSWSVFHSEIKKKKKENTLGLKKAGFRSCLCPLGAVWSCTTLFGSQLAHF